MNSKVQVILLTEKKISQSQVKKDFSPVINALRKSKRHGSTLLYSNMSRLDAAAESADVNDTVVYIYEKEGIEEERHKEKRSFRFIDPFLFKQFCSGVD